MLLTQLVQNICSVEASIVAKLAGNDFKSFGHSGENQLLLAGNRAGIITKMLGKLHLDSATACHDCVVLDGPAHNHDGIMERTFSFFHELLCTTAKNECARLGLGYTGEKVETLSSNLAKEIIHLLLS